MEVAVRTFGVVLLVGLCLIGCEGQSVTPEEVKLCAKRFASTNENQLSTQEKKDREECFAKTLKLIAVVLNDKETYTYVEVGLLNQLDQWVSSGSIDEVNSVLVPACGQLVNIYATAQERSAFVKGLREEWDFWVAFCVKGTVHRKHAQPDFGNKKLVATLCARDGGKLASVICERAGVPPR